MSWLPASLLFLSLFVVAIILGEMYLTKGGLARRNANKRVGSMMRRAEQQTASSRQVFKDRRLSDIQALDRLLKSLPFISSLELWLLQSGVSLKLGVLVLLSCGILSVVTMIVNSILGSLAIGLALGLILACIPWLIIWRKRSKRLNLLSQQFPHAVEMFSRALKAGHSISAALQTVAEEMEDPVAQEFNQVWEDNSLGMSLEDALRSLARRTGHPEISFFVTAIILQREIGGNLTEVLENITDVIRKRFKLLRQIRTLSAEGRISGIILGLLAPIMFVVFFIITPDYIMLLIRHPIGQILLVSAVVCQLTGLGLIISIVKIKV